MQQLNYEVEDEGKPFADVARQFLLDEKLIGADSKIPGGEVLRGKSLSAISSPHGFR